jgi:class 3 adenylate cyclase/pimeloyl-ACP methyl ester carboxylesterase
MEPRIQYVGTNDDVNLAYATLGHGHPLVLVTPIWIHSIELISHLQAEFATIERLAKRRMVVLCDNRGQGFSQREVDEVSAVARTRDLAAVVESLHPSTVDLMSFGPASFVAIRYAVENPEIVSHLVTISGFARGGEFAVGRSFALRRQLLRPIAEANWEFFIDATILLDYGWERGREIAELAKRAVSQEAANASFRDARRDDVTDILSRVQCPTLIVHSRSNEDLSPIEASRRLAAGIPGARFMVIAGGRAPLIPGWEEGGFPKIEEFLDDGEDRTTWQPSSGTSVILFADIADSTALTERLGDAAFRAKARELDGALRTVIRDHSGTAIEGKLLGDGVLAVFASARQAIEAALACASAGGHAGLPLHLGLHAGDVIREEGNVYGGAVNVAARISGLSAAGEVLVSETVRSLARTSAGVRFEDRGRHRLKGVGEAVRMWAVVEAE